MSALKRFISNTVQPASLRKPREAKPRMCDVCGKTYFRRNLVEAWPKRNPGHRLGWYKVRQRVCLECMTPTSSAQMLIAVGARWVVPKDTTETKG